MEQNNSNRFNWRCGEKKWYKKRWLILGLLVMAAIALVVARCLQIKSSNLMSDDDEKYQGNASRAARMIEGIDRSVNPCEDFHKFACSGWMSRDPMSQRTVRDQSDLPFEGILQNLRILLEDLDQDDDSHLIKQARAFYKMCMDPERAGKLELTPIFEMLSKLGLARQPPSLNDTEIDVDPSKLAGAVQRYLNYPLFVKLNIGEYVFDPNKKHMMIESARLWPLHPRYFINPEKYKSELTGLKRYVKETGEWAGLTGENSRLLADEIVEFKTKIAKIMLKKRRESGEVYPDLTVRELQNFTDPTASTWNWTKYFEAVFENTDVILETNVDHVFVEDPEYFQKLPALLSTTPRATIARYFWWEVYFTITYDSVEKYQEFIAELNEQIFHVKKSPRWTRCIADTSIFFAWPMNHAYKQRYINQPASKKKVIDNILVDLRIAFEEMVSKSGWIDKETYMSFLRILYAMRGAVEFPQWFDNYELMNYYHEGFEIISGKYVETCLKLMDVATKKELNSLREKQRFLDLSPKVVLAGLLQASFYEDGSESINYGALGAVLGYDITHNFIHQWYLYDMYSHVRQSWSNKALRRYDETIECFTKQYSSYHVPERGDNSTIDEADKLFQSSMDNDALHLAYRAYQKLKLRGLKEQALPGLSNYTQDQLFFLSYAQSWCRNYDNEFENNYYFTKENVLPSNSFRLIATLSNNEEFSKAWNCSIGSRMNPPHKCIFW